MKAVRPPLSTLLTTALATALAVSISACGGASPDKPNRPDKPNSTTPKAKAPTTTVLGKAGPKVGDCVKPKNTTIVMVNETVDCTLAHTGEVTKVVTVPGGTLNPERKADQKRAQKARASCQDAKGYIGYKGILYGTWNTIGLGPAKAAQKEGAHWLACVAIEYKAVKPAGKKHIYPYR
jgi:hypothetical protein